MFTLDTRCRSRRAVLAVALVMLLPAGVAAQQTGKGKAEKCNDVSRLVINPQSVVGGTPSSGQVDLKQAARAGGLTRAAVDENPDAVTVPSQIAVPAGATAADFSIQTSPVAADTHVFVYAYCGGDESNRRNYQISLRPPRLAQVELPPSMRPGSTYSGKLTLNGSAPSEGFLVTLDPSSQVTTPASVTIPPGQTQAMFDLRVDPSAGNRSWQVIARGGGSVIPGNTRIDKNAPLPVSQTLTAPRVVATPALTPKVPMTTGPAAPIDPTLAAASATSVTAGSAAQTITPVTPPDPKAAALSGVALTSPTAVASGTASTDPCNPLATIAPFRSTGPVSLAATAPTPPPSSATTALSVNPTSASAASPQSPSTLDAQRILTNPGNFTAQATAPANVRLVWDPVDGVRCYFVGGTGDSPAISQGFDNGVTSQTYRRARRGTGSGRIRKRVTGGSRPPSSGDRGRASRAGTRVDGLGHAVGG